MLQHLAARCHCWSGSPRGVGCEPGRLGDEPGPRVVSKMV
jgi:hypothetical protein